MLSESNPLVSDRQQQGVGGGRFFTDWTPVSCQGGYTLVAGYLDLGLASSPDIDHKRMWRCFVDAHRGQTCLNLMTSPTSAKPRPTHAWVRSTASVSLRASVLPDLGRGLCCDLVPPPLTG